MACVADGVAVCAGSHAAARQIEAANESDENFADIEKGPLVH